MINSLRKHDLISESTNQSMTCNVKFEDALKARLDMLQPSRQNIDDFLVKNLFKISNGVHAFIKELLHRGSNAHFVSNGVRLIIEPVVNH